MISIEFVLDASPFGIGGLLIENGVCTEFFSDALKAEDYHRFEHQPGDAAGQQTWESLAAMVAIRLWRSKWTSERIRITVRGDSIAMLSLVLNMRPKSTQMRLIGQEIALDLAEVSFLPLIAEHIPGVANVAADKLSRTFNLEAKDLPVLHAATKRHPSARTDFYFKSLACPHPVKRD